MALKGSSRGVQEPSVIPLLFLLLVCFLFSSISVAGYFCLYFSFFFFFSYRGSLLLLKGVDFQKPARPEVCKATCVDQTLAEIRERCEADRTGLWGHV